MIKSTNIIFSASLCLLSLLTCSPSAASTLTPVIKTETITLPAVIAPTPTPSPTPEILLASLPTPLPTTSVEMNSLLQQNIDNLAPQRQVMRPEFVEDVDIVGQSGASHYYLEIDFSPDSFNNEAGLILNGLERVQYTNTENIPLSEIYFHLYPNLPAYNGQMTIESVVVDGQIILPELVAEDTVLRIALPQPLTPGQSVDISLMYTATVPTQPQFGYNIFVYENDTAALAGFYPAIAVYDDEGWHTEMPPHYGDATYLDTAFYQVQLTVPQDMVVAASGQVIETTLNNDNTQTLTLASGPIREFYMAMSRNYVVATETVDGVVVNSYYPPHLEEGGQLALRYAADALRVYSNTFGPYPYTELDVAATTTTAGGIEYAGVVAINQKLYEFPGMFFEQALAHEVAHQWWYNVVGNDQLNEPWLDESLTNYSTIFYWEETGGSESAAQIIEGYFQMPYQKAKETNQDRAVVGPVGDFSEPDYGIIVYGKGPLFFNALREDIGDEAYLDIMQTYYTTYKYKTANTNNFLDIIEQVTGQNIDTLFAQWMQTPEN